ncbi:peptidyl-prolyl cis-trans isomerase [Anaeromicropila herbilytica]|uniref:PpiC domain-containing protein n=1 Tax=Anaeromicropila herbilytica TaxID=2785025 RepID=A0A7R7EK48_9FIRM|nr:peptidyl-prolyl cis-trans isomerase [Anaeromicropila herbilytica]BCN30170.1 hypothetical protein bsdtb5_14650 [Anaeromicropila herbilytica]
MKNLKKVMSYALIGVLTMSMTLVTGCKKKDSAEKSSDKLNNVVVTVDDTKIKLKDAMYFIFDTEAMGEYYDQMYKSYTGSGYWDAKGDDGLTNREKAKDYVMDNVVMIDILSKKANEDKLTLTDDDKKTVKTNVKTLLGQVSKEQLKITGFTQKNLEATLEKMAVAGKYYDKMIKGFNIDKEAIKAGIKKADYRQYNTDYILFPTTKTDASGKAVALSDKEKKEALKNAQEALTSLKAGKSFADLKKTYTTATSDSKNFTDSDQNTDAAYKKAAKLLNNKEFSNVVEGTDGYYVIQMTNNNSSEAYDTAVDQAVQTETGKQFDAAYKKLKKNYKVTVNKKVWDTITMGKTTIVQTDKTNSSTGTTGAAGTTQTTEDSKSSTDSKTDSGNK